VACPATPEVRSDYGPRMLALGPVGKQGVPEISDRLVQPEDWHDPYPIYRAVREAAPIVSVPEWDELICTRWADCERILRDPTFSSNVAHRRLQHTDTGFDLDLPEVLLFMDPPDHTRLRGLVSRAFTPRTVEQLRSHVADLVQEMLGEVDAAGFDLIEALAYPLPVTVICELLGVPVADRHLFGPWSSDTSRLLDGDLTPDDLNAGLFAAMQLIQYLNALFEERRAAPQDDLVSALLAVEEEGDRLSESELGAIVLLLFVAGHETTMNLIGNGTVALLRHRSQWDRLVADPALAPNAVEELLRFDGPVHATQRIATEDARVGEVDVERGQSVICHLAAANRDPARFDDPDGLDIGRQDIQHLTFSHGIHYCLGAALARLEGQEVFKALPQRFPGLDLAEEPVHRDHFVLRGYRTVGLTTS
jgi:pimeloyl-[acyl-carrier protein] synthase